MAKWVWESTAVADSSRLAFKNSQNTPASVREASSSKDCISEIQHGSVKVYLTDAAYGNVFISCLSTFPPWVSLEGSYFVIGICHCRSVFLTIFSSILKINVWHADDSLLILWNCFSLSICTDVNFLHLSFVVNPLSPHWACHHAMLSFNIQVTVTLTVGPMCTEEELCKTFHFVWTGQNISKDKEQIWLRTTCIRDMRRAKLLFSMRAYYKKATDAENWLWAIGAIVTQLGLQMDLIMSYIPVGHNLLATRWLIAAGGTPAHQHRHIYPSLEFGFDKLLDMRKYH